MSRWNYLGRKHQAPISWGRLGTGFVVLIFYEDSEAQAGCYRVEASLPQRVMAEGLFLWFASWLCGMTV